jgi:hypothetical protein
MIAAGQMPSWDELVKKHRNVYDPPVQPSVKTYARRNKNLATTRGHLRRLDRTIKTAPIYLCSTHGEYDRRLPLVKKIVPPNTFIFEAQNIGDLTLTDIDKPLWELLQAGRRWGFLKYLKNDFSGFAEKGVEVDDVYKHVFANLILYKPGDEIYERVLSIGGGKGLRKPYENMGFYRFDVGSPEYEYRGYGIRPKSGEANPYEILPHLQSQMVENNALEITDCNLIDYLSFTNQDYTFRNKTPIKFENDLQLAIPPGKDPRGPRIFIFSSCAAVDSDNSPEGIERWKQIASLQRERILESWSMGLLSLAGGSDSVILTNDMERALTKKQWDSGYILRKRKIEPASFSILPENPRGAKQFSMADPDLDQEKLFAEGGRKTRKNLRKGRKTRRTL